MQWYKKFFRGKSDNELTNRPSGSASAIKIINDYGAFLESAASAGLGHIIVDAKTLPWPKEEIKKALLTTLDSTSDEGVRDLLAAGLLHLPYYQVGVGSTPVGIDPFKFGHNPNIDELTRHADEVANYVLQQSEAMKKWEPIVQSEKAEIKAALKSRGLILDS